MIHSAVVVPEPEEQPHEPAPSLKRRQSSISTDTLSKRPRLTPGDSNSHGSPKAMSPPPQRKPSLANTNTGTQERQRTQRLFGNVFSTLNKSSAKPAHRKRDEIEKRQQERLKQQTAEAAEEKRKRQQELDATRSRKQKLWDEESMHARHLNMRATARFLQTKSHPHLYYKPWELRADEEKQIKRQIAEVDETIKRELAEHGTTNGADTEMAEVHPPVSKPIPANAETDQQSQTTTAEDGKELVGANNDVDTNLQEFGLDTTNATNEDLSTTNIAAETELVTIPDQKPHDDHTGEELVEGQEDDVIY